MSSSVGNFFLDIHDGTIKIDKFSLVGDRKQGSDVSFEDEFDSSSLVDIATSGMVPFNIAATCSLQKDWGVGTAALPTWFNGNNWDQVIWYVVSTDCVESVRSCGANLLTVRGSPVPDSDKRALLVAAGAELPGQNRQPVVTDVSQLLDSAENTNGDTVFEILPIDATSNDQIRVVAP